MQDIISEITSHRRWVGVLQCKGLVSRDAPGQPTSGKVARFVAGLMTSEATLVAMVTVTRRGGRRVWPLTWSRARRSKLGLTSATLRSRPGPTAGLEDR